MKKKLLVTDYDNTFELHYEFVDKDTILHSNIEAINKFMKNNLVCIATGRHFLAIQETLLKYNIKFNYLIANYGSEIYDSNYNLLFYQSIDEKDLTKLQKISHEVFYRYAHNSNFIVSANLYFNNECEFKEISSWLKEILEFSYVECKFPKIKIINRKCSKREAIKFISKVVKVNNKDIFTIGDDVNDVEMIAEYNGFSLYSADTKARKAALKLYNNLYELVEELE